MMQDRFKFRVWCKTNQEWKKDEICITNRNQYLIRNFAPKFTRITDDEPQYHEISFCTGLKDQNGKLIYEGDIVKLSSGAIGFIVFECQAYAIRFSKKDKYRRVGLGAYRSKELEIIGNIYENPELLKDGK